MTLREHSQWQELRRETLADIRYWQGSSAYAHRCAVGASEKGALKLASLYQRNQALAHHKASAAMRHLAEIEDVLAGRIAA